MKLGTETASLVNHLMSGTKGQPDPAEGMGLTFLSWTDRSAGTINKVYRNAAGRPVMFVATEDKATRVDNNGMSESQRYVFERQPDATPVIFRIDRKGQWRRAHLTEFTARWVFDEPSQTVHLDARSCYHDFSF